MRKGEHLHLDVELAAGLIASLDVQDGQLIVEGLLGVEGIEQVEGLKAVGGRRVQDTIQHVDQDGPSLVAAEDVFEGVIDFGIDVQDHPGTSLRPGKGAPWVKVGGKDPASKHNEA
jgi:hypothetical protein